MLINESAVVGTGINRVIRRHSRALVVSRIGSAGRKDGGFVVPRENDDDFA